MRRWLSGGSCNAEHKVLKHQCQRQPGPQAGGRAATYRLRLVAGDVGHHGVQPAVVVHRHPVLRQAPPNLQTQPHCRSGAVDCSQNRRGDISHADAQELFGVCSEDAAATYTSRGGSAIRIVCGSLPNINNQRNHHHPQIYEDHMMIASPGQLAQQLPPVPVLHACPSHPAYRLTAALPCVRPRTCRISARPCRTH